MQQVKSSGASPQFVRVEQQTQRTHVSITEQPTINFNPHTGQLTLPTTLNCDAIVSIIKGLSA